MKLKNGQLIIYEVKKEYLEYLSKFDDNVRRKSDRRYTGILISDKNIDYCVPLTCQIKNRSKKLTINIKDKEETIAQLTINNMIPVKENFIEIVDISTDKDKDYLNKEIEYLRKDNNLESILKKASHIQKVVYNPKSYDYSFFRKLCGNYQLLEEKCIEYDRVQNILHNLKNIDNKEDLYYIYDNLKDKEVFEDVALQLDKSKQDIQKMSISEINNIIRTKIKIDIESIEDNFYLDDIDITDDF